MFAPDLLSTTYSFRPLTHLPSSPVLLFTVCVIFICHISPGPGSPGRGHLLNSVSNYAYPFSDWFYKCYHVGSSRSPRFWTNFLCIVKPVLMSGKFLQSFKIRHPKSGHDFQLGGIPQDSDIGNTHMRALSLFLPCVLCDVSPCFRADLPP